jgi:hypothetical protein
MKRRRTTSVRRKADLQFGLMGRSPNRITIEKIPRTSTDHSDQNDGANSALTAPIPPCHWSGDASRSGRINCELDDQCREIAVGT